jgi:hypothetical protein
MQEHDDVAGEGSARRKLAEVARSRGDRELARRRLEDALAIASRTDDWVLQRELEALARTLDRQPPIETASADLVTIAPGGQWFSVGAGRVDLARRGSLRRVLVALVEACRDRPGLALDVDALLRAGWPGERMHPESGAARVYMAIRRLRGLGLERALLTSDEGYLLDPRLVRSG